MTTLFHKREASHAGSWYLADPTTLNNQLTSWLGPIPSNTEEIVKAIIAPHAGFSYSGPTAAKAFSHLNLKDCKRVFLLGPSHCYYLENCAFSLAKNYSTPFGDIKIDQEINKEISNKFPNMFSRMSKSQDEDEHSLEMMLPFIHKMMKKNNKNYTLVPILVGNLDKDKELEYGKILAPYLSDKENCFVISSDFCHWGSRFRYRYYDKKDGDIFESIEKLDKKGMSLIENKDFEGFSHYLSETKNTICGRHPIGVFLAAVNALDDKERYSIEWKQYAQSNQVRDMSDSSVSYASAVCSYN